MEGVSPQEEAVESGEQTREFDASVLSVVSALEQRFQLLDRNQPVLAEVIKVCIERKLSTGHRKRV